MNIHYVQRALHVIMYASYTGHRRKIRQQITDGVGHKVPKMGLDLHFAADIVHSTMNIASNKYTNIIYMFYTKDPIHVRISTNKRVQVLTPLVQQIQFQ